jgi:hypothetical protein
LIDRQPRQFLTNTIALCLLNDKRVMGFQACIAQQAYLLICVPQVVPGNDIARLQLHRFPEVVDGKVVPVHLEVRKP